MRRGRHALPAACARSVAGPPRPDDFAESRTFLLWINSAGFEYLLALSNPWTDIWIPLVVAVIAGTVAAFWPWIQAYQRRRRFEALIRRELAEVAPFPAEPSRGRPWWEHATKRFVHEELFRRSSISQNRDFLLGLDPTVVYLVSQLWIALEKRDGKQWLWYLGELATNSKVGGAELRKAHEKWQTVMDGQRPDWLDPTGSPSDFRR